MLSSGHIVGLAVLEAGRRGAGLRGGSSPRWATVHGGASSPGFAGSAVLSTVRSDLRALVELRSTRADRRAKRLLAKLGSPRGGRSAGATRPPRRTWCFLEGAVSVPKRGCRIAWWLSHK